jgi:hypothetical protein
LIKASFDCSLPKFWPVALALTQDGPMAGSIAFLLRLRGDFLELDSGAPAVSVADVFFGMRPRHPLMAPWLP